MTDQPSNALRPRRLLILAPSIVGVLMLLGGSVLPPGPPPRPDGVRAVAVAASVPTLPLELPPASVTAVSERGPAPAPGAPPRRAVGQSGRARPELLTSNSWALPDVLLSAYRQAVAGAPPGCHLPVSLLAAIGQVESGSLAGRSLDAAHRAVPPVLGPVLDGVGTAAIRDTDDGRLDGNPRWDRAVGPMQFIPGTWAEFGVDGDGDGRADPQDVDDAAAAAAGYLCAGGRDLALASDLRSAILAYNHSTAYVATVLAWQRRFAAPGRGTVQAVIDKHSSPIDASTGATLPKRTATRPPSRDAVVHTPASAVGLAFTTAPGPTSTSGTALASQPVVTVQDAAGNTVTTDTSLVTLTLTLTLTTPAGASLTCAENAVVAIAGVASFTGCAIDRVGAYTLTAAGGSLTSATSNSVSITPASAVRLAFTTAPGPTSTSGTALASQPVATVQDAAGNTVTTDTSLVTLTLTLTTPAGASLTCAKNAVVAVAGVASFTGCAIDRVGVYTLTAASGSLTSATSVSVTITAAACPQPAGAPVAGSLDPTADSSPVPGPQPHGGTTSGTPPAHRP